MFPIIFFFLLKQILTNSHYRLLFNSQKTSDMQQLQKWFNTYIIIVEIIF